MIKILLVEDDPIVMMVHHAMLTEKGYAPKQAITGTEALSLSQNGYDVIWMDLGLPDISGTEVVAKIREWEQTHQRAPAYIIAVTAYTGETLEQTCLEVGINYVAHKPLNTDKLLHLEALWLRYLQK